MFSFVESRGVKNNQLSANATINMDIADKQLNKSLKAQVYIHSNIVCMFKLHFYF